MPFVLGTEVCLLCNIVSIGHQPAPHIALQANKLQERIDKAHDRIFKDFSKAVKVKNWREHEAALEKQLAQADERSREVRRQIAESKSEEERLRTSLQEGATRLARETESIQARYCGVALGTYFSCVYCSIPDVGIHVHWTACCQGPL